MQLKTGNDIRAERSRRRLSQVGLSKLTGGKIDRDLLRYLERGQCLPTPETITEIEAAFADFDARQVAATEGLLQEASNKRQQTSC